MRRRFRWLLTRVFPATVTLGCVSASSPAQTLLFADEFATAAPDINRVIWDSEAGGGHPIGRTWLRASSSFPVPVANGYAELRFDTFNPGAPGSGFLGTEIATRQYYPVGKGIAFEARVWIDPSMPRGTVTSLFSYVFRNPGGVPQQDEIDWEFISNRYVGVPMPQVSTNVYKDEFLGAGQPIEFGVPSAELRGHWHTYRVEWYPDRVRWLMNGRLVVERFDRVPDDAMSVRLNFWAPSADWASAFDSGLAPAFNPGSNVTYRYRVDYLRVFALPGFGDVDLSGDGRVDAEDLYRLHASPQDLNGDAMFNGEDIRAMMLAVREGEPLDITMAGDPSRFPFIANPSFDALIAASPLAGWNVFGNSIGNVLQESIVPRTGPRHLKIYGQFNGVANSSGLFQDVPVRPGQMLTLEAFARHISGDALAGSNVAYLDLLFRNSAGATIQTVNQQALSAASPINTHIRSSIVRTVPSGAVSARVQLRLLQSGNAAGAVHFDDVSLLLSQP